MRYPSFSFSKLREQTMVQVNRHRKSYLIQIFLAIIVSLGVFSGCSRSSAPKQSEDSKSDSGVKLIHLEGNSGVEMGPDGLPLAGIRTGVAGVQDVGKSLQPTGEVAPTDTGTIQITSRL